MVQIRTQITEIQHRSYKVVVQYRSLYVESVKQDNMNSGRYNYKLLVICNLYFVYRVGVKCKVGVKFIVSCIFSTRAFSMFAVV